MAETAMPSMDTLEQALKLASKQAQDKVKLQGLLDKNEIQTQLAALFGIDTRKAHERIEVIEDPNTNKVTMPKGWNAHNLLSYAQQLIESEEAVQQCHHAIPGIPADVLVGLWRVLEKEYNFARYLTDRTWFGDQPPPMVNLKTGPGESVSIPFAKISPPAWEGGYIRPVIGSDDGLIVITGQYKRKFQKEVSALIKAVEDHLTKTSIYRGKSIILNFDWKENGLSYNPDIHSPSFESPPNIRPEDVILNEDTEAAFRSAIYSRLQHRDICAENGIPFKHGVVLGGRYGTGKTMTGAMISRMATENGITFIHLKNADYLAEALLIAKHYGPSVLFCEDIDQVAGGETRNADLNDILNTLDGVDTKGMDVISIFTTNHPEKLNSAFMRAGRVDSFIFMGHPDEKSAIRFLKLYARNVAGASLLSDDIDYEECGKALAGKSPSFISGIINSAKTHCISRNGAVTSLIGQIGTEDIVSCARAKESQIKMTEFRAVDPIAIVCDAMQVVGDLLEGKSTLRNAAQEVDD